jgi:hypothetical protein
MSDTDSNLNAASLIHAQINIENDSDRSQEG